MVFKRMIPFVALAVAVPALASQPTVTVGELKCLPNELNASLKAKVEPDVAAASVRLYFRRLNPVGAFYYNEMWARGGGAYWSVFPKPEDRKQHLLTDDWWEVLKDRHWMKGRDRDWLENWLEEQEEEAAEYYVAVYDATEKLLGRSNTQLVQVLERDQCEAPLTRRELGWATNLTVGETTEVQANRCLFHWLCDGVVTRISWQRVLHPDECCRACVVAGLWPLAAGGVLIAGQQPEEVTPQQP